MNKGIRSQVEDDLRGIRDWLKAEGIEETDVRLNKQETTWTLHSGAASYDTDHRGYWGADSVRADDDEAQIRLTAEVLIEQVEDAEAMCSEDAAKRQAEREGER